MNKDVFDDITGVILVGGKSRRMGRDKAFLPWEGAPLIDRTLSVFRANFASVLLVGDGAERFADYGCTVIPDIYPGSALGGLYTGLFHADRQYIFAASCDLPFPNLALLRYLCSLKDGYDCVVPHSAQGMEPLFAVYAKSALPAMLALLEEGDFKILRLYPKLNTRFVGADELTTIADYDKAFVNINTPEEFQLWSASRKRKR